MFKIPKCVFSTVHIFLLCRDVLQCTMITHQILLRGAAQCYLLQTAMHLTDVVSFVLVFFCSWSNRNTLTLVQHKHFKKLLNTTWDNWFYWICRLFSDYWKNCAM